MLNPGSNSSGMGSGAASSSSAGSPASKQPTTNTADYQHDSVSSPASIHVNAIAVRSVLYDLLFSTLRRYSQRCHFYVRTKVRVPTGQRKLEKVREFEWSGKGHGERFFTAKVTENEKLVPPDVRFSG